MPFVDAVTLNGALASLEPLRAAHEEELLTAVADGQLWQLWFTFVPAPKDMRAYIAGLIAQRDQGTAMPFVVRDVASGRVVGATRYMQIDGTHRRLEIGGTWYARSAQRTGINTECKLMLLTHAFEQLDCIAVEFRTDWFNRRSQAAIERLGAKRDAVLRNHMIMPDGRIRDTVVYSIIANEWPGVKTNLQFRLQVGS